MSMDASIKPSPLHTDVHDHLDTNVVIRHLTGDPSAMAKRTPRRHAYFLLFFFAFRPLSFGFLIFFGVSFVLAGLPARFAPSTPMT